MQDRFTADIGDFAKFALLRALTEGRRLGVGWYLFPDESHTTHGSLTGYLEAPHQWRHLDPVLFDGLRSIVRSGRRNVREIEASKLLGEALFSSTPLSFEGDPATRARRRATWFRSVLSDLADCDVVFADPDNGLCEDHKYDDKDRQDWKRMPLSEAHVLAAGRTGVLYHHNTRWQGGHANEIQHYLKLLGRDAVALYWRQESNRTFFIIGPTKDIKRRIREFAQKWSPHFALYILDRGQIPQSQRNGKPTPKSGDRAAKSRVCPECGHAFRGAGWDGIDAHWKAHHEHIMPYDAAWPIIRAGRRPSADMSRE